MKCPGCPNADRPGCYGEVHAPACGYVAAGRREWIDHLIAMATGAAPAPSPDVRTAMAADLCPMGSGPCGCGSGPPRLCSSPDRPLEVRRPACLACIASAAWESSVDPAW